MEIVDAHTYLRGSTRQTTPLTIQELLEAADSVGVHKLIQVTTNLFAYDNGSYSKNSQEYADRIRVVLQLDPLLDRLGERLDASLDDAVVGLEISPSETICAYNEEPMNDFWCEAVRRDLAVAVYDPGEEQALIRAARDHPNLRLVINHCNLRIPSPDIDAESDPDFQYVIDMADLDNVFLKVSALPEITGQAKPGEQARGILRLAYDWFGSERMIWGSNYPRTLTVSSYEQALVFVKDACDFMPKSELAEVLGGTAKRVFKL